MTGSYGDYVAVDNCLRMALAEAGYPEADVWGVEDDGPWFCENVPPAVWDRACEVVNR